MNQYETVFIVTPVLNEDDIKKSIKKYVDLLKKEKAEFVNDEHWGLKQLAYPIKKKTTGIYHILEYKTVPETIDRLEVAFNRDENILRYLTTRLDKYAVAYNERRRNNMKAGKDEAKEAEAVAEPAGDAPAEEGKA